MPLLTLENVSKAFGGFVAVRGVSLQVEAGEGVGGVGGGKMGSVACLTHCQAGALFPPYSRNEESL